MARTWLSITVELVEGQAQRFWPRPGWVFAAARSHRFADLARSIDDAFARWDHAHLYEFLLEDGQGIAHPNPEWDEADDPVLDGGLTKLSWLNPGEQFVYVFDLGDGWHHICTVGDERIDPADTLGIIPERPLPYWGWGDIPDQYGRRFDGDDGESPVAPDPSAVLEPAFGHIGLTVLRSCGRPADGYAVTVLQRNKRGGP